uniref:Uncharacterized protein n=1 Tax=Xiphophorus couchianus TaxID=32473 RepID=A0A3B5MXV5_9TELE
NGIYWPKFVVHSLNLALMAIHIIQRAENSLMLSTGACFGVCRYKPDTARSPIDQTLVLKWFQKLRVCHIFSFMFIEDVFSFQLNVFVAHIKII